MVIVIKMILKVARRLDRLQYDRVLIASLTKHLLRSSEQAWEG